MRDSTFRTNPDVIATPLDECETVLLDLKTRRYYSLNETGSLIWELLVEGLGSSEIVREMTERYEVGQDEARRHFNALLTNLQSDGLVQVTPADGS